MKKLFIVFAIGSAACTKSSYIPNHDQISQVCKRCIVIKEKWDIDLTKKIAPDSVIVDDTLCDVWNYSGAQTDSLLTWFNRNKTHDDTTWTKICNTGGEPIYIQHILDSVVTK